MKKFSSVIVFFSVVLCAILLLCPSRGYAETMTLTLESVGGQSSGTITGDYVYPYNFSFNGSATLTPLMCISYENEIYFGETWQATLIQVTGSGNTQYIEAAYIFSLATAPNASANTIAIAQWANWELFDENDPTLLANLPSGYQPQIDAMTVQALAFATANPSANFPNIDIFIPTAGSQPVGDGLPQFFVGDPVPPEAPEPSSYLLFGTGLLGLAALWFRRRCVA